jgi:class 3 adenylate cyclase/tetratricopeptide (TPR) repeat protein
MNVAEWLRGLGLEEYGPAFHDHDIDGEVLRRLTGEDLRELGVASVGHRRRLLDAIAALRDVQPAPAAPLAAVPAVGAAGIAERRQLTVMFSDLIDSTMLASRLDPEEMGEVIGAYHRCVAEVVRRFDGFLAKYLGDGVLAYFGYPAAHEDDAERAVRAGLEVTRSVAALRGVGSPLNARVGIATGLVVVGEIGGGETNAVVGETPNLAARLQAEAPPGGVVIAPATRRLTGAWFRYHNLGARPLKGIDEPLPLTQVLDEQPAESRFAATRAALLTPFVGRDQEIGLLLDRWRLASDGEGQVVLLSGEAGIGKSRISEILRERVAEVGTRIRYQCSPYYTDTALFPAITQLRAAARIEPDDPPAAKLDKLEGVISPASIERDVAIPLLADLLAIPTGDRYPTLTMGPELRKVRTSQVLAEQLFTLAQQRPVLVLLEDAHWIDPTTRELFDSAIEQIGRRRVMLLVTCRPEFHNPWGSHSHVTTLTLNRLGQRQCADLIGQVAGGRVLPAAITDTIAARADGVPLFIEELTKAVLESGLLRETDGGLVVDGPLPPLAIPTTLQGSLLARLDRLSATREVAQIGSAIGREFDYQLLATVAVLPDTQLREALSQLESAGLIFRRGTPPEAIYTFKHALVQDAAHDSLLRSRRQQLHARITEAIERHYPETASNQPQLLAQHYAEAGFAERSAKAWLEAGRLATSRSASQEAAMQFARGIDVLQGMEAGAARDQLELDLQVGRGSACAVAYGHHAIETEKAWARAIELLRDHPEDPRNFWARRGLSSAYSAQGNIAAYAAIAEEILERARRSGNAAGLCVAHMMQANLHNYTGKFAAEAQSVSEAALHYRADEHQGSFQLSGLDIGVHIPMGRMHSQSFRGDHAGADESMNEMLRLAEEQPQVGTLCWAIYWASFRCLIERDFERAGAFADRTVALATEHGIDIWATASQLSQGAALVAADPRQALTLIGAGLAKLESIGSRYYFHPTYLCFEAEALLRLGQVAEARGAIDRALAMTASSGLSWWDAELHRIHAAVIRAEGGGKAAVRDALARAIAIAEQQGSETFRRRAAADMHAT